MKTSVLLVSTFPFLCQGFAPPLFAARRGEQELRAQSSDESSHEYSVSPVSALAMATALSIASPVALAVSGGGLDYAGIDISGQDFSNGNYKGKDFTQGTDDSYTD